MADFTTRIELHGATDNDYATLHRRMEEKGFTRWLSGTDAYGNAGRWAMPTAEYDLVSSTLDCAGVRQRAKEIAEGVKSGGWVLVTQVATRSWSTLKIS